MAIQKINGDTDPVLQRLAKENRLLKKEIGKLKNERDHLEGELAMAVRLKYHLMPNNYPAFPDVSDIDIFADSIEIKQLGGDYYDFFRIDADHIGIVIADIFDGGAAAALYMVAFKVYLTSQISFDDTESERVETLNNLLCWENEDNLSLSAIYGVYEISTGKLNLVNAGHEPVLIMRDNEAKKCDQEVISYLLGVISDMKYESYEITLAPGDKILLYTDGVANAMDESGMEYGEDRLINAYSDTKDMSAEETIAHLENDFSGFVGKSELLEDASYLCLIRRAGDK
jgi:serine phosphatase RsbU (regulator of sigma subunit)